MAQGNLNQSGKRGDSFNKNAGNIVTDQLSLGKAADDFKEMNDRLGDTGKEFDNINSLATQLNNILKETLNFQGKLGREHVKQQDFAKEVLKLRKEESQIEERINVKIASMGQGYAAIAQKVKDAKDAQVAQIGLSKQIVELTKKHGAQVAQKAQYQKAINDYYGKNQGVLAQLLSDKHVRMLTTMEAAREVARDSADELESQWGRTRKV